MIQSQADNSIDNYRDRVSKFSGELDLGLIFLIVRKSVWIIVLFLFVGLTAAFVYLRYSQPIYQSSSVIQINDNSEASKILDISAVQNGSDDKLAEAIEQIRSRVFLKRVVEKSDIRISYFNEGTFKNNELYKSSPYFVKFNVKKNTVYGIKIYISFTDATSGQLIFDADGLKQLVPFKVNTLITSSYFDISIRLNPESKQLPLINYGAASNKSYFIIQNVDDVTTDLQSKIDVRLLNMSAKTIMITIKDINSEKAKDVINLVAEEYLVFDVERKSESSKSIIAFIDEQLNMVYDDLKISENNLKNFRKDKSYTEKNEALTFNLTRLNTIEDEMLRVELDEKILAELQAKIVKSKGVDTYQLISLIAGTEYEASIKEYTENIQKLLSEKENLLYNVTPNSENIKQINYNIEIQKKLLIESINSIRLNYKSKYTSLIQKSSEFKSKYERGPDDEMEHSRLMRLFSISEKYYTLLLEKKTEFSISKAGFVSQNVILEKAIKVGAQVAPIKSKSLLVAIITAILSSLIVILIRYFLHDKITSVSDIIKYTDASISVLGIVPKYDNDIPVSQLVVDKNPKSQIAEAFRSIRSNLQFINNTDGPKIIAVTSSISGEGKTFVSLNISGILAYTGKKIVLLDLDMRKPKIHKGFGIANDIGMSTILTGMSTIKDAIHKSHFPNLDYITAGPIPPNPSELIISDKLNDLITELKKTYDYIVFDNPPIGLVTDGITTIQKADYPIYVFRADYSKRSFVQILDKLINEGNIKNLSMVLNGVNIARSAYGYKYGYGYGYGYDYGNGYYSDDNQTKKNPYKPWK